MRKVLVIDGQVFQTPALYRGMGKYSNELIAALIDQNKSIKQWDQIIVIYSKQLVNYEDFIDELGVWSRSITFVPLDLKGNIPGDRAVVDHNRQEVNQYISSFGEIQVDFLILAIFQSQIASVFPDEPNVNRVLLMHDLIPHAFFDVYLKDKQANDEYYTKMSECLNADGYITVSKTVSNDLSIYLGIDKNRTHFIGGGSIKHSDKSQPFKIKKPFILMPTGNDVRKNNKKGILGFKRFNEAHNNKYHLVITSFFLYNEIEELKRLADNVHFAGNVSGEQLNYLFAETEAILFPTQYEGLGLPILEAIEAQKPIACSDIPVFREMSKGGFVYFDYRDTTDIADKLEEAVNQKINRAEYSKVIKNFSWDQTSKRAIEAIASTKRVTTDRSLTLDFYTANPTGLSFSGWLAQTLLAETARLISLRAYTLPNPDPPKMRKSFLEYLYPFSYNAEDFYSYPRNSHPIYFLDDSPESKDVLCRALAVPGILLLLSKGINIVWDSVVEAGLSNKKRQDIEIWLSKQLGLKDPLASLIYRQKTVIVFDEELEKEIKSLIAKLPECTTSVMLSKWPVTQLPYPEVLPEKNSIEYLPNDDTTDRLRYEAISTSDTVDNSLDNTASRIAGFDARTLRTDTKRRTFSGTQTYAELAETLYKLSKQG